MLVWCITRAESRHCLSRGDLRRGSFWLIARGDSVVDKAFLQISLRHHKRFMKEDSFPTKRKLTKWHLWFIRLHSPYLLGVAAHLFRATLACSWEQELHRQALHLQEMATPSGRERPSFMQSRGREEGSTCSLGGCPVERGENGKGGMGVRGGDGPCAPRISRWTWERVAVLFPG